MRLFGLEKEFFVRTKAAEGPASVVLVPAGVGYDACGYIGEARGQPFADIHDAVGSLKADYARNLRAVHKDPALYVDDSPLAFISNSLRLEASRKFAKGLTSFQNIYGHENHKARYARGERTAGVHLSVTTSTTFSYTEAVRLDNGKVRVLPRTRRYNQPWDFVQFIRYLDKRFVNEIKEARRMPGFYEIKSDGRIEYRSLPSNINLSALADAVADYKWET